MKKRWGQTARSYKHPLFTKGMRAYSNSKVSGFLGNSEPLFYEYYPGSINDVSQLLYMLEKVEGYGTGI